MLTNGVQEPTRGICSPSPSTERDARQRGRGPPLLLIKRQALAAHVAYLFLQRDDLALAHVALELRHRMQVGAHLVERVLHPLRQAVDVELVARDAGLDQRAVLVM